MIREKDLERHKFYTTDGTDIWRVKGVSTFTLVELENCETGGTASARVGERSAGGFVPVKMPVMANRKSRVANGKPKKVKGESGKSQIADRKSKRARNKMPSSKHRGVSVKVNAAGENRYYARASMGRGKYKSLGAYSIEEAAAAAVADFFGEKQEAARLRKIAEQKENEKIDEVEDMTGFMCTGCGAGYDEKPEKCGHCNGYSFVPVKMPVMANRKSRVANGKPKKVKGESGKSQIADRESQKMAAGGSVMLRIHSGHGVRKGKQPSSKYKGVTKRISPQGKVRFVAQVNRDGKYTGLGTYRIEEAAAAAVADFFGEKQEAARLRKIAEQKENEKIDEVEDMTGFMCTGCGAGYDDKPEKCRHCNGYSFVPARRQ